MQKPHLANKYPWIELSGKHLAGAQL